MWRTRWRCKPEIDQGTVFKAAEQLGKSVAVSPVRGVVSARCRWTLCPQSLSMPTGQCGTDHLARVPRRIATISAHLHCSSPVTGASCVSMMPSLEFEGTNGQSVLMECAITCSLGRTHGQRRMVQRSMLIRRRVAWLP